MRDTIDMARESLVVPFFLKETNNELIARLRDFEALVRADEREFNSKARAGKPRQLPRLGMGMLHGEQQHCFEMGWKEGAAAVRAAIRARGNT